MALPTAAGTEDELDYSNQAAREEECVRQGITELEEEGEVEEEDEEYICLPCNGSMEQEEEEEMDEEQQILCEGSLLSPL